MERYRRFLWKLLMLSLLFTCVYTYGCIRSSIPDEINLRAQALQELDFGVPFEIHGKIKASSVETSSGREKSVAVSEKIDLSENCQVYTGEVAEYQMNCSLFGVVPIKDVNVHVIEEKNVIPSGAPIGIYMRTAGVMVIGTGEVKGIDGMSYEPAYGLVKSGDYIEKVNGERVSNKRDLVKKINSAEEQVTLTLRRNGVLLEVKVKCIPTSGDEQKTGIWVRDNTQGIGTITYVTKDGSFGGLGHGINDVDTGKLMELGEGSLYATEILSVIKGGAGNPGALEGVIYYDKGAYRGRIEENTNCGIFGSVNDVLKEEISNQPIPIALKQEIKEGDAKIRCNVDGTIKEYEIEILEVQMNAPELNKSMVLQIKDPELLALTGGIVQGMSGSPIIQDGKIVGAVTHVFVNDATKGYGIFIENMLEHN